MIYDILCRCPSKQIHRSQDFFFLFFFFIHRYHMHDGKDAKPLTKNHSCGSSTTFLSFWLFLSHSFAKFPRLVSGGKKQGQTKQSELWTQTLDKPDDCLLFHLLRLSHLSSEHFLDHFLYWNLFHMVAFFNMWPISKEKCLSVLVFISFEQLIEEFGICGMA